MQKHAWVLLHPPQLYRMRMSSMKRMIRSTIRAAKLRASLPDGDYDEKANSEEMQKNDI